MKVTLHHNIEQNGLELKFEHRLNETLKSQLRKQGFRWHSVKRLWYAKKTDERLEFANTLVGEKTSDKKTEDKSEEHTSERSKEEFGSEHHKESLNTFAAHYDSIGDTKILDNCDIGLRSYTEAYFSDYDCYYRRTYSGDFLAVTDLSNAGKVGKSCPTWHIYPKAYGEDVCSQLCNVEHIETCKDLVAALKQGRALNSVKVSAIEEKAVDVFSPFREANPLKSVPEQWTKRNFAAAVLSGQIFQGEISYHHTDDGYSDVSAGRSILIPDFARDVVENWGQLTSVYAAKEGPDHNGILCLHYSEHSNSGKKLWFDLNCDIGEGKRRAMERQAGLERYNKMMESCCISVKADQVEPQKLYAVQRLEMDDATNRYKARTENIPGYMFLDLLENEFVRHVLSLDAVEILPTQIYEVSDFFHAPNATLLADERVIDCGNHKCIVLGMALQELIAEEKYLPHISLADREFGPTFQQTEATLEQFAKRKTAYFVLNAENYQKSLDRLRSEYQRANQGQGIDAIICSAAARSGTNAVSEKGKIIPFSR